MAATNVVTFQRLSSICLDLFSNLQFHWSNRRVSFVFVFSFDDARKIDVEQLSSNLRSFFDCDSIQILIVSKFSLLASSENKRHRKNRLIRSTIVGVMDDL